MIACSVFWQVCYICQFHDWWTLALWEMCVNPMLLLMTSSYMELGFLVKLFVQMLPYCVIVWPLSIVLQHLRYLWISCLFQINLGNYNAEVGYVSYTETNVALIVGLTVGLGLLAIIVAAVLVWFFILRNRKFHRRAAPSARVVDAGRTRASSNSYQEARRDVLELTPLRQNKGNLEPNDNIDLGGNISNSWLHWVIISSSMSTRGHPEIVKPKH